MRLFIMGLGPGDPGIISQKAAQLLREGMPLLLRTSHHPVADYLTEQGISWTSCDDLYGQSEDFTGVYEAIWQRVAGLLKQHGQLIYAVPGHPLVAEKTVSIILARAPQAGVRVSLASSMSSLEATYEALLVDPSHGFVIADALDVAALQINPSVHSLYLQLYDRMVAGELKLKLLDIYPPDLSVALVRGAGTDEVCVRWVPLWQLDHESHDYQTSLFVPACKEVSATGQLIEELTGIMDRLRAPEGCPWDLEQDHRSLKPYLVEEAYEVLEAIDQGEMHKLADELGDLLLQVVFHAQIAKENGDFDMREPIRLINQKLKRRHPHIFGNAVVGSASEVVENWQQIKAKERANETQAGLLETVPRSMPGLMQAFKLQKKAARVGFDWPDVDGAWLKVDEEIGELREAALMNSREQTEEEVGDLLFAVVNVARFLGVEPETALLSTITKFRRRFAHIENRAKENGKNVEDYTLEQLDQWWDEAKKS